MTMAQRPGFTLAESLIAMVVLSVAMLGILQALTAGHTQAHAGARTIRASHLATAMMEEILAHPYRDPEGVPDAGPDEGESTRAEFDNMDDYDGFKSKGRVKTHADEPYGEKYAGFRWQVKCRYTTMNAGLSGDVNGLEIMVKVNDARDRVWRLTRFVAEPGA